MPDTINSGVLKRMSAIIGICGENFCSFIADTRRVKSKNGDWEFSDDNTSKIFKINDRVLFGLTGVFNEGEDFLAPFKIYPNKEVITLRTAYKAVADYVVNNLPNMVFARTYFIGGKDNKGRFLIHEIHINIQTQTVETNVKIPTPPQSNFGITCGLPHKMADRADEIVNMVEKSILTSSTHNEVIGKACDIIKYISKQDSTVGNKAEIVSVF